MDKALLKLAQAAVEMAKTAGADHAMASTSKSRKVELTVRDGKVETVKEAVSKRVSLRIWVDGRYGSHRSNDLRIDELKSFIADGVALTRAVQPDSHRKITDPALYGDRPKVDLKLKDPAIAALTRDDRLAICMNQNQALNGTPKLISVTSSISDSSGESAMAGSNGFSGMQDRTSLWFGTEVSLQDAGDKKPEGWMWAGARHRAGTPDPTAVAKMALIRAQGMLGAKKGPSKKTVMIVDPSAGPRLIGRLLRTANGRSVSQGKSFWSKKIGKKAVSDTLSITDDPSLVRGLGSRTYDSEGITAKPLKVIESGVLRNLYIDTYYGSKLSMAPTTGGRSNLVLGLGKRDLKSILADCPDAFYVTGWLGGNADAATGDYSFGFRGFLIKDGKRAAPVSEMNITGNLLGLFSKLTELGNDPWPYSSVRAPTLVFDGVDFSGA